MRITGARKKSNQVFSYNSGEKTAYSFFQIFYHFLVAEKCSGLKIIIKRKRINILRANHAFRSVNDHGFGVKHFIFQIKFHSEIMEFGNVKIIHPVKNPMISLPRQ